MNLKKLPLALLICVALSLTACASASDDQDDGTGGTASAEGGNKAGNTGAGGEASGGSGGGAAISGSTGGSVDGGGSVGGAGGSVGGAGGGAAGAGGSGPTDAKSKFHLYLMLGQSNMEGTGVIEAEDLVAPPRVLKITASKSWVPGNEATSVARPNRSIGGTGVSIGRTFAMAMMASENDPDIKIGLMNLAVSGSPIQSWIDPPPARPSDPYDANYAKMLPYLREALKTGVLKAVLWHQGEANGPSDIAKYLPQIIENLRTEVNDPNLPFVLGEIGLNTLKDSKNIALAKIAQETPRVGLATCENLSFKDNVHYDSPSYREYGRRYAAVYKKLIQTPAP